MNLNSYTELEKIAKIWQIQLNLEYGNISKNVRLSFKDIGAFAEFLALDFCKDYTGGGSGGMGFDLLNRKTGKAIEVKSCCIIQNAKCNSCGAKFNDLFLNKCPNCESNNYSTPTDSRFGIDASELLNQLHEGYFDKFIMCCIKSNKHDINRHLLEIELEWFTVDFNDKLIKNKQLEYFINQKTKGKAAHCNLLPYSFDFYKLCPKKIHDATITLNYANLNKQPKVIEKDCNFYVKVPISVMKNNVERELFKKLKSFDSKTQTADCKDFTNNIPYRNKNLGKERGDTRTNIYNALKNKVEN